MPLGRSKKTCEPKTPADAEIEAGSERTAVSESGASTAVAGPRPRHRRIALKFALMMTAASVAAMPARADDVPYFQTRTTYGDIGLIEMPNARMAPDGQISFAVGALTDAQRINLGFQILPWLEGSFRYSHIPHFFDNGNQLYDRSFGLKMRLFQETAYSPALSVGVRDLIGTGVYGQEYVVATKKIYDFDFTAGLGWGRLASTHMFPNPLGYLFSSFKVRSVPTGEGGKVDFGQLFHGPYASLFGGISWQTPIDDLALLVEYSSDRYLQERRNTKFFTGWPVNFAASYRVLDNLTLTGGWLYGTTWGAVLSFDFDPTKPMFPQRMGTPPLPAATRTSKQREAALVNLEADKSQLSTLNAGGPWVSLRASPQDVSAVMAAAPSAALKDYEVDGRTLAINVQGPEDMRAQCSIFAQVAASNLPGIDTVAVTDLSDKSGSVTLCSVAHRSQLAQVNLGQSFMADAGSDAPAASGNAAPAPGSDEERKLVPQIADPREAERKIRADARAQHVTVDAVSVGSDTVIVYFTNTKYNFEADAIGRLTRVLLADAPASVEIFRMISLYHGVPVRESRVLRAPLERILDFNGSNAEIRDAVSIRPAPMDNPVLEAQQADYPRFGWSIFPRIARSFFDPKAPAKFGIFADVDGYMELWPGMTLESTLEGSIYNNLGSNTPSNSTLPHVRSDFGLYYEHGANGISFLDATYRTRLATDLFAEAKAGYLEDMFMGAGGQLLWRPNGQRWALGVDVYLVWQRNFDRLLGVQHYNVATGHASLYYQSPWYGIDFAMHAGRYLAGDWGGTFEVSRHFATGMRIGAFATITNVPFAKFGEGSFDKGIIIRIPLEWLVPFNTQSAANLDFRPLSRDGGQRLVSDDSLYDETTRTGYGEIDEHMDDIVSP
jgi:hypothetical protein